MLVKLLLQENRSQTDGQKSSDKVATAGNEFWCLCGGPESGNIIACVADETKPRYSPSANQRPKACSAPRVLPVLSIIGSNWLLHMAVLSCTVIGRVDVVEPWLRSR